MYYYTFKMLILCKYWCLSGRIVECRVLFLFTEFLNIVGFQAIKKITGEIKSNKRTP
jgi:hypothetical protein